MEEASTDTHPSSSPNELAIRFLLRHAQRRQALVATTIAERRQLAADMCKRIPVHAQPERISTPARGEAPKAPTTAPPQVTREGSFVTRFSLAYAAARHPTGSQRRSETNTSKGPGARHLQPGRSDSAAA